MSIHFPKVHEIIQSEATEAVKRLINMAHKLENVVFTKIQMQQDHAAPAKELNVKMNEIEIAMMNEKWAM